MLDVRFDIVEREGNKRSELTEHSPGRCPAPGSPAHGWARSSRRRPAGPEHRPGGSPQNLSAGSIISQPHHGANRKDIHGSHSPEIMHKTPALYPGMFVRSARLQVRPE